MKIVILGVGHMGSWFMNQLSADHDIAVFDIDESKIDSSAKAKWLKSLSEISSFNPEMLINAVSLENTISAYNEVLKSLSDNCLLCDLASVKGDLQENYDRWGRPFVSVHPMFGPTFADLNSLKEESLIIITESDPKGAKFFEDLFSKLQVDIFKYSFAEHDDTIAYSLTTPFVASLVFAGCIEASAVPGTTFKKHREIAKGLLSEDDNLLAEVLFNEHSIKQIENITGRLEHLKHIIKDRDNQEAAKFFSKLRANMKR